VLFNILILNRLLEEKSSTYGALGWPRRSYWASC
jgi:hypothetical protein